MKTILLTGILLLACAVPATQAQQAPATPPPPQTAESAAPDAVQPWTLAPFTATYEAWYKGKRAGDATLQVVHKDGNQWRLDLEIRGERGVASLLRLNIQQSTVFDVTDTGSGILLRPLSQSTVRKAVFGDKQQTGSYDWRSNTAQWEGKVDKDRRAPVALKPGDMSSLLLDLAIMRDARPGAALDYRVVDNGRARQYQYAVAAQTEIVQVGELSYDAMRVARTNGGDREQIFWVASGVPTPVRMLQRDDGEDAIDLRLTDYQGVQ
ncbi:DUF3108 domain-containing protein [Pseudoxanthomonas sp. X-1]|uniref:DUF3108 domain-containing protein n=1 Tax=Pseudoxanthomonas sp. X-1 TaxID=2571115 RepID=UPI00110AA523|nr:DUF3108 domain-containing protein [Pseudoxanthomonas sp. X-1]TMN19999.1 DUF3108 domain-containing protein [Pseudoxanthomonas sp. X-1]UAY76115.1 DUF3108 domain-containing protein [Pseudoxanthomonas sp. X-1]